MTDGSEAGAPADERAGHLARARAAHERGELDAAEADYLAVLASGSEEPRALNGLGIVSEERGDRAAAARWFERALIAAPDAVPVLLNLGALRHEQGDLDAAQRHYARALAIDGDALAPLLNLGRLLFDRGRIADAEPVLRRAAGIAPGDPLAQRALGMVLFELQRFAESLAYFERVRALAPRDGRAAFDVARALDALGRPDEAIAALRESLAIEPRSVAAREQLALQLEAAGRAGEARALLADWLVLEPAHPVAAHLLAALGGAPAPERASSAYVRATFDRFAADFDVTLARLQYRAPQLVADAVAAHAGEPAGALDALDAGCGTGLLAPLLRPWARWLLGLDLSGAMLERARARGGYDALVRAELATFLEGCGAAFDLIAVADTLCYFGSLERPLAASARALRPRALLVFTLERLEEAAADAPHRLHTHGRYAHAGRYVDDVLRSAGLMALGRERVTLRLERGTPVGGWLVVARAQGA